MIFIRVIIQYYKMSGFKGLLPRSLLSDQSFQPILKKGEDYRKSTQTSIDFFQQITKSLQNYALVCDKNNMEAGRSKGKYYRQLVKIFQNISKEMKILVQSSNGSFRQLTSLCNTIFLEFSNFILNFQQLVRSYQASEQILFQLSKKYFRTHKTMVTNIQAYKSSFTDVKLIYNTQEKLKRYSQCETTYKSISQQYSVILEKTQKLTQKKVQITKYYERLEGEFSKVMKVIGSKIISETKNFVSYYCSAQKQLITLLAQNKFFLQQMEIQSFFSLIVNSEENKQIYENDLQFSQKQPDLPLIFKYHDKIKEEFLPSYNVELINFMKLISEKIEERRNQNRMVFEFFSNYFKILDKVYQSGIKDIINFFEKIRKKISQVFGNRLVSFLKSINSILELSTGINQKLIKRINPKLQLISSGLDDENKLLKFFEQEFKTTVQKFIGKKEMKKIKEEEFTEECMDVNVRQYRKQISQKSQFFIHLIRGFRQKMGLNYEKVKKNYNEIINDLEISINQLFSLCCEYKEIYFGSEEFINNFKKYQADINSVLEKEKTFFDEMNFNILKKQQSQVQFDGEFFKIQDFKKIKKPVQNETKEMINRKSSNEERIQSIPQVSQVAGLRETVEKKQDPYSSRTSIRDTINYQGKQEKYLQFLINKVNFIQGETLIKTFSCALADKIILQGRLYITNQRMCFHSKFNSGNVFFGGTFIEIPKKDIKKIQKKTNAIFFDNSISVTTVNGQVFFTSFFSRNQAFDLLCKTFEINNDEEYYEEDEKDSKLPDFLLQLEQDDDMKEEQVIGRQVKINEMVQKFEYKEIGKLELKKQGLNALKLAKLFYGSQQISINRRTHPSFLFYFKDLLEHKQIQISEWQPKLSQILNASNLKSNCPLKSTRKIKAVVPITNSGVPFMPKNAQSYESSTLYIVSKHKWILEGTVESEGAPYTDTFKVQLRTEGQSNNQGQCRIRICICINFIKSTMMKGMIESKSIEETSNGLNIQLQEIKRYLVSLQKSKKKMNGEVNLKQELQEKEGEITSLVQERNGLKKELKELQEKVEVKNKIMVGAIVLNIFLLLILMS